MFTLIVQRMPISARWLTASLCRGRNVHLTLTIDPRNPVKPGTLPRYPLTGNVESARLLLFVGSGIDRAQIGQLWVRRSTCGEVVCCRAGPGRLRGSKNRSKTRPPIYRESDNKHTTHSRAPNKILELQAC